MHPFSLIRSSATFATSSAVPGLPAGQQEEQRYYEEIIGLKGILSFCRHPSGSPSQDHQWTGLYAR